MGNSARHLVKLIEQGMSTPNQSPPKKGRF
ncbi:hypothetical protein CY0110_15892 [Crocosphaera chwakensis CCY0110]|uniref:Uncharacterized protein n=1 Tax=Crocosphaera chwakensis CCY0110 TaxID=391612 RepID=A3IHL0_9CHRO|nr:hypothetical protein CY0110_15892 [Crocosphaera chwakensis CCY0110]